MPYKCLGIVFLYIFRIEVIVEKGKHPMYISLIYYLYIVVTQWII